MNLPTQAQVYSFGRHVVTFAMGGVTVLATFKLFTGGQAQSAGDAINQISSGLSSVIAGVTTLIGLASGLWAAWSASPFSQLLSVSKNGDVKQIVVASKALADAVPSDKVVAH